MSTELTGALTTLVLAVSVLVLWNEHDNLKKRVAWLEATPRCKCKEGEAAKTWERAAEESENRLANKIAKAVKAPNSKTA